MSSIVKTLAIAGGVCTLTLLMACYPPPTPSASSEPVAARTTPAQILPIGATATIAQRPFELEVAKTQGQQALGMMYRTFLPDNRGMLFPFSPPQAVQFWMKNCKIALDMIFLYQGKVVAIAHNAPPCKSEPCPLYGTDQWVDQVIEIRGGQAAQLGLKVGDTIAVQLKEPSPEAPKEVKN